MRKSIYTLNLNGEYAPQICAMTYPMLRRYAAKIGAEFHVITEDRFPGWPANYNKLQIYELAKERKDDWSIYFDSDAVIHPDCFDVTDHLPMDTVMHHTSDLGCNRWKYDRFFRRDGRNIGSCGFFCVASSWCREFWKPLTDLSLEEALENISPAVTERNFDLGPEHFLDEYVMSRNVAKYGLKFETFVDLKKRIGDRVEGSYVWHTYLASNEEKVRQIAEVLLTWQTLKQSVKFPDWMTHGR